jgi:hypothetical protein
MEITLMSLVGRKVILLTPGYTLEGEMVMGRNLDWYEVEWKEFRLQDVDCIREIDDTAIVQLKKQNNVQQNSTL